MLKNLILKFKWWQLLIYEIGLIGLGIVIGVYWLELFENILAIVLGVSVICLIFIAFFVFKQLNQK
jgi:hypothetical protein